MNKLRPKVLMHFKNQCRIFERQMIATQRKQTRKNVHQLRITTRRIRSALWLVENGVPKINFGTVRSDLRKLSWALGSVREIDIALKDANKFHLKAKKIEKRLQTARKALFKQTHFERRKKIIIRLNKAFIKMQKHQEQMLAPGLALLRYMLVKLMQKNLTTDDDLHEVRIITKKARYIFDTVGKPSQPLHDLQDVLGKGHDLRVLQEFTKTTDQIQDAANEQYEKGLRMIRPTLRFAIRQLPID